MEQTARLAFPLLVPGQLEKEMFHNEAIQAIDLLLCPVVDGIGSGIPPAAPEIGGCYVVGASGTGGWEGQDGALACFTDGGWRFAGPFEGMQLFHKSSGQMLTYRSGLWESGVLRCQRVEVDGQKVLGARQPAIAEPQGGVTVDAECRVAVVSALAALRSHGLIG